MAKTTQTQTQTQTKKKRPVTSKQTEPHQAQDSMNMLYVAHQVHTLANVLFHRIAMAGQDAWSRGVGVRQPQQPAAFGFGATPWNAGPQQTAAGAPNGVSQPLLYWYP